MSTSVLATKVILAASDVGAVACLKSATSCLNLVDHHKVIIAYISALQSILFINFGRNWMKVKILKILQSAPNDPKTELKKNAIKSTLRMHFLGPRVPNFSHPLSLYDQPFSTF